MNNRIIEGVVNTSSTACRFLRLWSPNVSCISDNPSLWSFCTSVIWRLNLSPCEILQKQWSRDVSKHQLEKNITSFNDIILQRAQCLDSLLYPSGQNRQKNTEGAVPYCQKYTPTDCFFGEFAHWMLLYICRVDSG